jgi:hypothetical protein
MTYFGDFVLKKFKKLKICVNNSSVLFCETFQIYKIKYMKSTKKLTPPPFSNTPLLHQAQAPIVQAIPPHMDAG